MKNSLLTIIIFIFCINFNHLLLAQIGISEDGSTPAGNAILDVSSTTKGVLIPRMNTAQRNALTTSEGLTVYDTDTKSYWFFNGSKWQNMLATNNTNSSGGVGYGTWGDCALYNNISEYCPVTEPNPTISTAFGISTSISGNFAVIGAEFDDVNGNLNQGSASIFQFDGTSWVFMQKLFDQSGSPDDNFGHSVSLYDNFAIVGNFGDDDLGAQIGSASLYHFNGTSWDLVDKILNSSVSAGGNFGRSVFISENYIIIGAWRDAANGINGSGSASIYQYNETTYALMQTITDNAGAVNDNFGNSVSISGNYAIVGAYFDDNNAIVNQGSASIFQFDGANWVLMKKIFDASGAANDNFGISVSISGNYAIVGANSDDLGMFTNRGSANIYKFDGTNWVFTQQINDEFGAANDEFGYSVQMSENYIIVGCWLNDIGTISDQGSAIIFVKIGLDWVRLQNIIDPLGGTIHLFGASTAIDAKTKRFLIGSYSYSNTSGKAVFGKIN